MFKRKMENIKNVSTESKSQLKRHVGFADIFFMSFGGQAPFLSMLTYATAALLLALFFSPIVLIIGTLVVLINGVSVYYLSKNMMRRVDILIMHSNHYPTDSVLKQDGYIFSTHYCMQAVI